MNANKKLLIVGAVVAVVIGALVLVRMQKEGKLGSIGFYKREFNKTQTQVVTTDADNA